MIDYHHAVVGDARRLEAWESAITRTVSPGDVVVDVGTGTGILACIACRAGARHVYAIERTNMAELALEVFRANGFAERVTCLQADARWAELPEEVDVILGDIVGVAGIEDDIVATMGALATRFLRPGGRVIPRRVEVFVAPWESAKAHEHVAFWDEEHAGVDLSPVRRLAANTFRPQELSPEGALGDAVRCFDFALGRPVPAKVEASVTCTAARDGILHGLAVWFRAELDDEISLHTSPGEPSTVWRQGFLPVATPRAVARGDIVNVKLSGSPGEQRLLLGWEGGVARAGTELSRFGGHMFAAEPVSVRALELMRTNTVPATGPEGAAVAWTLDRMSSGASLTDLVRELQAKYPELFGTKQVATRFVAQLSSRFGRGDPPK